MGLASTTLRSVGCNTHHIDSRDGVCFSPDLLLGGVLGKVFEWFILRSKSQDEQLVEYRLQRQGFDTFLPLSKSTVRDKSGLLCLVHKPLFGPYLFVRALWSECHSIVNTRGVSGFIGWRPGLNKAPSLSDAEIGDLRLALTSLSDDVTVLARPKPIEPGDLVRILLGPYRDRTAPVQALRGSRVQVLLRFAGALRSVTIDQEALTTAA